MAVLQLEWYPRELCEDRPDYGIASRIHVERYLWYQQRVEAAGMVGT